LQRKACGLLQQPGVQFGVPGLEGDLEAVAEPGGERRAVEEEVRLFWEVQPVAAGVERHAGHHHVHVGMMLHLPSPGVEHGGEAWVAAEFGPAEVLHRAGGLAQQEVVEDVGFEFAQAPQVGGHREGEC